MRTQLRSQTTFVTENALRMLTWEVRAFLIM